MALHKQAAEMSRLHTSDLIGGQDFWKREEWREWKEGLEAECGQTPGRKSEPGKERLIVNSQGIFRDSEICIDFKVLVAQSCPILCDSMDCDPSGSFVRGILQARILKWVAIRFSRGSSQTKDGTQVFCFAGRFFVVWTTRKAPEALNSKHSPPFLCCVGLFLVAVRT